MPTFPKINGITHLLRAAETQIEGAAWVSENCGNPRLCLDEREANVLSGMPHHLDFAVTQN